MWASAEEAAARFYDETFAAFDWRARDAFDNGEFLTSVTLDFYDHGKLVFSESFSGSSEFGEPSATAQAASYAHAWAESQEFSLEERLGRFGLEWEREQAERSGLVTA
jgi:hypothetical protein